MADEQSAQSAPQDAVVPPVAEPKKRGKFCTKDTSEYPLVKFNWADGTQRIINVLEDLTESDRQQSTLHGTSQKWGDSYAASKTLDEAKAAFDKLFDAIITKKGGWKARVEGEVEEPAELLAQAIVLTLTKDGVAPDLGTILAKVREADRKQRNAWKSVGAVAGHLAELKGKGAEVDLNRDFGV